MKNYTSFTVLLFCLFFSNIGFAQSVANYSIVFESFWETPAEDPVNGISTIALPSNAHWSPLAIATHKTVNSILEMGVVASAGIELIAEEGNNSTFQNEVTANPDADKFEIGSGLNAAQGTITKNIQVSSNYPFVSLASMIAPSPDWFIAVNSENLRSGNNTVNNGWKASFTLDVYPYDAGTEDGNTYSGSNSASNPIGVITSLSNQPPFDGVNSNMSHRIGTVTFNYIDSTLSLDDIDVLENISIYPNPTQGKITLSNIKNIELKSAKIYNILGRLVKDIPIEKGLSKLEVDLSHLNKGVYLLSLKSAHKSSTKKLVIN
ncbi:spondin domain-containing protein [Hwangdonia lutea]|uniref:Spondin domain-containing protein n=1 Tax=Hwangdonia lutea TaxID=3075823 RepID=A0AA97ELB3_9FLAO|nr:spondin domain-containing protein [Hwangdonia sp. SCSIO 19198]WOD42529.1 spondin domain-containing protein [Hwangdonia sp. SCSIO 19198]